MPEVNLLSKWGYELIRLPARLPRLEEIHLCSEPDTVVISGTDAISGSGQCYLECSALINLTSKINGTVHKLYKLH